MCHHRAHSSCLCGPEEAPSKLTLINQPNAPKEDIMITTQASFTLIEDVPVHSFTLIEGAR